MTEIGEGNAPSTLESFEQGSKAFEKIFAAAQPGAVFGEPIVSGPYTLITAREVAAGGGFGYGRGFGPVRAAAAGAAPAGAAGESRGEVAQAGGGGGGGGGGAMGRPVAIIVIGPDGVKVKPVVDVTKLAIAGITAMAAMAAFARRMRRFRRG